MHFSFFMVLSRLICNKTIITQKPIVNYLPNDLPFFLLTVTFTVCVELVKSEIKVFVGLDSEHYVISQTFPPIIFFAGLMAMFLQSLKTPPGEEILSGKNLLLSSFCFSFVCLSTLSFYTSL